MQTNGFKIQDLPKDNWKLELNANFHVYQPTAPNWFHRKMQYWLLGWEWIKLNP